MQPKQTLVPCLSFGFPFEGRNENALTSPYVNTKNTKTSMHLICTELTRQQAAQSGSEAVKSAILKHLYNWSYQPLNSGKISLFFLNHRLSLTQDSLCNMFSDRQSEVMLNQGRIYKVHSCQGAFLKINPGNRSLHLTAWKDASFHCQISGY